MSSIAPEILSDICERAEGVTRGRRSFNRAREPDKIYTLCENTTNN
jgi:hypothetical protein